MVEIVRLTIYFAVIGPLAGALVIVALLLPGSAFLLFLHSAAVQNIWGLILYFAFMVGAVPAALTGFIAALVNKQRGGLGVRWIALTAFTAELSWMYLLLYGLLDEPPPSHDPIFVRAMPPGLAILAALSGALCWRFAPKFVRAGQSL